VAAPGAVVPTRLGRGADEALAVLRGGFGEHASGKRIVSDGLVLVGMHIGNNQ
jgi:hypothetical protein